MSKEKWGIVYWAARGSGRTWGWAWREGHHRRRSRTRLRPKSRPGHQSGLFDRLWVEESLYSGFDWCNRPTNRTNGTETEDKPVRSWRTRPTSGNGMSHTRSKLVSEETTEETLQEGLTRSGPLPRNNVSKSFINSTWKIFKK